MRKFLGYLQIFIGVGAVAGGVGLVADPTGGNLGIDLERLSFSPFLDFFLPGLVLLVVNGFGHLIAGVFALIPKRPVGALAVGMGGFLTAWIVAQVWWIGLLFWLQPLYFGLGILELGLGVALFRQELRPEESREAEH